MFDVADILLLSASTACASAAIYTGVTNTWVAMAVCIAACLGFLAIWLRFWIPKYRLSKHFVFEIRGIKFYALPDVTQPTVADVYVELATAERALHHMISGLNVDKVWKGVRVYLVPDIDESRYPDLGYYHLTGLDFGTQKLVEYRPGSLLKSTALAHELCHCREVHDLYPNTFEDEISKALFNALYAH